MHPTGNVRVVERLAAKGLLTPEQQEAVLNHHQRVGGRIEEALLDTNSIDEPALLKFLAGLHETRFVSTDKLSKADIDKHTLEKVPKKIAERDSIFPVLFDAKNDILSVVTPDPDNAAALHEVQLASGAKKVNAFIARPLSVRAAINKAYNGDIHAFAVLDRSAHEQFTAMLDVYERNLVSEETMTTALAADERVSGRERTLDSSDLSGKTGAGTGGGGVTGDSYLETLNVLISLIENSRPDLRGHSSHVARLMKKIAERIGVPAVENAAYVIAAYIHDLGKMGAYHLTALNVAEYEGHRTQAAKLAKAPLRLMESVELPRTTKQTVESMYERFDGQGVPNATRGKDIPLGARLLAIADTYADLTQNPRNPYRKTLRPLQACEVLARYKEKIFDPNLVDLFKITMTGDDLKARLLANRHLALLVDPDPEETTVLELRMVEQGFEVQIARSTDAAIKRLQQGDIEVVISELDVQPQDGFALLSEARKFPWGEKLPWIFLTNRGGKAEAQRAFELNASDFMTKPVAADVLVTKTRQIIERSATQTGPRGVSGSLSEMSLPDIVQVLWHGRKTGALKIRSPRGDAGEIHFVEGAIFNALFSNMRGEEAFYGMLALAEGEFNVDPNFKAPQQVIQASPEALLLEGMRRVDEAGAGG